MTLDLVLLEPKIVDISSLFKKPTQLGFNFSDPEEDSTQSKSLSKDKFGDFFSSVINQIVGGELEGVTFLRKPKSFGPGHGNFYPDICIPSRNYKGSRTFVECKFIKNSVKIRGEQFSNYLRAYNEDSHREDGILGSYFVFGYHNLNIEDINTEDITQISQQLSKGIEEVIIIPQYVLLNRFMKGADFIDYTPEVLEYRDTSFSRKFIDSIASNPELVQQELAELKNYMDDLNLDAVDLDLQGLRNRSIETRITDFSLNNGINKIPINPFKVRLITDDDPSIFSSFLSTNKKLLIPEYGL